MPSRSASFAATRHFGPAPWMVVIVETIVFFVCYFYRLIGWLLFVIVGYCDLLLFQAMFFLNLQPMLNIFRG